MYWCLFAFHAIGNRAIYWSYYLCFLVCWNIKGVDSGLSNSDSGIPEWQERTKAQRKYIEGEKGIKGIQTEKWRKESKKEKNNLMPCGHCISPSFSFLWNWQIQYTPAAAAPFFPPRHWQQNSDSRLKVADVTREVTKLRLGKTSDIKSKGPLRSPKIALFITNFEGSFLFFLSKVWKYPLLTSPAYIEILSQEEFSEDWVLFMVTKARVRVRTAVKHQEKLVLKWAKKCSLNYFLSPQFFFFIFFLYLP